MALRTVVLLSFWGAHEQKSRVPGEQSYFNSSIGRDVALDSMHGKSKLCCYGLAFERVGLRRGHNDARVSQHLANTVKVEFRLSLWLRRREILSRVSVCALVFARKIKYNIFQSVLCFTLSWGYRGVKEKKKGRTTARNVRADLAIVVYACFRAYVGWWCVLGYRSD